MPKRIVDIVIASLLLTATAPFALLSILIIKLDSDGPAIFRQTRMGKNFRRFELLKLRTMDSVRSGSAYTLGSDLRITRVGRYLRWLKFDELPQLWNVLRGEMSLVGPRPVVPELVEEFQREYASLLAVRPGLTDPATLKYCRESELLALVPDPLNHFKAVIIPDKLRLSQDYLERSTVQSDVLVMLRTTLALFPLSLRREFGQQKVEKDAALVLAASFRDSTRQS